MKAIEFLKEIWKWIGLEFQSELISQPGERIELGEAKLGKSSKGQSLNPESDFRADLRGGVIFGEADDTSGADHNLAKYILVTSCFSKKIMLIQVLGDEYSDDNLLSQEKIADKLVKVFKEKFSAPFCYCRVDLTDGEPVQAHLENAKSRIKSWANT